MKGPPQAAPAACIVERDNGMDSIRQMAVFLGVMIAACAANAGSSDPDLIFRKSTTFKLLTPNDKLTVYGIDDPLVDGVVCHYTTPEKGGLSGASWLDRADVRHLACVQAVRYDQVQGDVHPR
jgi:catabolite regulation protein CreA